MLIPHADGKWSWDDGAVFDSQQDALASAEVSVTDAAPNVYTVDSTEPMTVDDDD